MSGYGKLPSNDSMRMLISDILKDLGISPGLAGYHQLRASVEYVMEDMSRINSITKDVYVHIANRFATTPTAVERNLRHAISIGWCKGNPTTQRKLFGYTVGEDYTNPKVGEFICTVADYIHLLRPEESRRLGRIKHTATNVADAHPVDEFKCSSCGVHLKDWVEVYFDIEDPDDEINREYVMKYCPECGHQIVEE